MEAAERKMLEEKIKKQLSQLKTDIADLEEEVKPIAPENAIGRISRMDAINNKSVNEAALRKAKLRFNLLENALKEIKGPEFGICKRCGKAIQVGRLFLQPQTKSCISCAH